MALLLKFLFFLVNVLILSVPIAIFEILIEKDKGWCSGHPKDRWYTRKICENNFISRLVGVPYFLVYNLFVSFIFFPALLLVEYLLLFPHPVFLLSVYIGALVVEDFLWFVLNWHFPALKELFKGPHGAIWWHKKWIKITKYYYLPNSYLAIIIAIALVLAS